MRLEFDVASCIRATSKFSQCSKCVDICPTSTIEIVDNIPAFTPSACIDCGGCVGVCPTESFFLTDFSSVNFFFEFLKSKETLLACNRSMPCLSVLSVEHLISLALASDKQIFMDIDSCSCGGDSNLLREQIEKNFAEANFILESFSDKQIEKKELPSKSIEEQESDQRKSLDRRSFLSLKNVLKSKEQFDKAVDSDELRAFELDSSVILKIKDRKIPDKRKLLFSVLKRAKKQESYDVLSSEDISFTSQKYIDESCTNCQICYRICPTGALSSDSKFSVINFDSMMCVSATSAMMFVSQMQ